MHLIRKPRWALPENRVTPEAVWLDRRRFLAAAGFAGITAGIGAGIPVGRVHAATAESPWTPAPETNPAYADAGRPVTDEGINSTYNNFYEFGSHKRIAGDAQALETEGWTIQIDGLVEKPFEIGTDDLLKQIGVQERIIRHRCVEAWSMVVPWIGFPLKDLVALAKPLGSAKYVRFETFHDPNVAPGQLQFWYPWPYVEGVTMAEAENELSFLVVGAYGKVLHKQFGAPIRLHLPWKYGFKSVKSIARISFVEEQPLSFWEELQASEYGFWANVNPEVPHPRWSQATERVLGTEERIPTQLFNGYAEEVAHLYTGMEEGLGERLWR